jgi:hypothetical protein
MQSTGQKKFLAPSQKSTGSFTVQNIVQSLQQLHYPNSLGNRRLGIIMKHVLQQIFQIHNYILPNWYYHSMNKGK